MTGGRPLRFLAILLCGWAGARGIDIYRRGGLTASAVVQAAGQLAAALGVPAATAAPAVRLPTRRAPPPPPSRGGRRAPRPAPPGAEAATPAAVAPAAIPTRPPPPRIADTVPPLAPAVLPPVRTPAGARWRGSAWLIARDGGAGAAPGGQLGASQAGVRVLHALGHGGRLAIAARLSAPVSGRGREAALGLDWQPTRAPVYLVVEQRVSLDGGPDGTMAGIVGGFGPAAVIRGVTVEAYGQAGVVARAGGGGFADGAIRAAHPLATVGGLAIDIGAGVWGGVQRGAARLDAGPSLGLVVPLAGRRVRLAADWRQRIAGGARPGSGPALSIGTDF